RALDRLAMGVVPVAPFLRQLVRNPNGLGGAGQVRFTNAHGADPIIIGMGLLELAQVTTFQDQSAALDESQAADDLEASGASGHKCRNLSCFTTDGGNEMFSGTLYQPLQSAAQRIWAFVQRQIRGAVGRGRREWLSESGLRLRAFEPRPVQATEPGAAVVGIYLEQFSPVFGWSRAAAGLAVRGPALWGVANPQGQRDG